MITEERKKYNRDYYLKHKETLLERQRIYRESNREILREKGREYVKRNSDAIKKYEEEHKESRLKIYKKYRSKHKLDRQLNKVKAILYKGGKCSICGLLYNGENGSVFDFHHIDTNTKDFDISKSFVQPSLTEEILLELDKCVVVCSNCHRQLHYNKY